MDNMKLTLIKSLSGRNEKHVATAHSMGLKKIGDSTVQPKNPQTEGKIAKISYLLTVEDLNEEVR